MMLIDLNDETMWQTENNGAEYFTEVPFSHPGLPPGILTVQINCEEAAFSPGDRAYAQHCLDSLHGRVDEMIARLLAHIGHNNRSVFSIERGAKSLILFAGDPRTSVLGVLLAETRASVCVEWDGDVIIRIWGQAKAPTNQPGRSLKDCGGSRNTGKPQTVNSRRPAATDKDGAESIRSVRRPAASFAYLKANTTQTAS